LRPVPLWPYKICIRAADDPSQNREIAPVLAGGEVTSCAIPLDHDQFLFGRVIQLGVD